MEVAPTLRGSPQGRAETALSDCLTVVADVSSVEFRRNAERQIVVGRGETFAEHAGRQSGSGSWEEGPTHMGERIRIPRPERLPSPGPSSPAGHLTLSGCHPPSPHSLTPASARGGGASYPRGCDTSRRTFRTDTSNSAPKTSIGPDLPGCTCYRSSDCPAQLTRRAAPARGLGRNGIEHGPKAPQHRPSRRSHVHTHINVKKKCFDGAFRDLTCLNMSGRSAEQSTCCNSWCSCWPGRS